MSNRMTVVVASIVGAFCVYCGQSAVQTLDHDAGVFAPSDGPGGHDATAPVHDSGGFLGDAHAETAPACCVAQGYTFTKLAEGDLGGAVHATSPVINVGAYREVVVYSSVSYCLGHLFMPTPEWQVPVDMNPVASELDQRYQVNAPYMVVQQAGNCGPIHYVVNGVQ